MAKQRTVTLSITQAQAKARDGLHSTKLTREQNTLATAKLPDLIAKAQTSGKAGFPLTQTATASVYVEDKRGKK